MSITEMARMGGNMSTEGRFEGKTALITGSTSGIGLGIAEALAAGGARIVLNGLGDRQEIDRTRDRLAFEYSVPVVYSDADLSMASAVGEMVAFAEDTFGSVDILVNNAGIARDNLLMRMTEADWDDVVNTNLSSLYRLCRPLLRGMTRARWGRIVNIGSVVGRMGNAGQTNYVATKAAAEGFTRALAQEVGSRHITVNAVAPGFIATDMTEALNDDQKQTMLSRIPLGRMGEAGEVANLVAFLVSDAAAYITGETIHINGGLYMA